MKKKRTWKRMLYIKLRSPLAWSKVFTRMMKDEQAKQPISALGKLK